MGAEGGGGRVGVWWCVGGWVFFLKGVWGCFCRVTKKQKPPPSHTTPKKKSMKLQIAAHFVGLVFVVLHVDR